MVSRILGMGDILTLVEKAGNNIEINDVKKIAEKIKKKEFDMNDLLNQMKQIKKIGSIKNIVEMIPGVGGRIKDEDLEKGENKMVRIEAIIYSMTKKEREKPSIIDYSRKKRIALGSGTTIFDINQLLKQYDHMQKIFKKFGGKKGLFNRLPFSKFN